MAIKIPQEYLSSDFDFGFTAVDEGEVVEPIITDVKSATTEDFEARLQPVSYTHIKWPNRRPVIEKQIEKILSITRS